MSHMPKVTSPPFRGTGWGKASPPSETARNTDSIQPGRSPEGEAH